MNRFLHDLALAHQQHEGFYQFPLPGSLSYRNNNPGNLRRKDGAFFYYPTYAIGFAALEGDISAKIENRSPAMNVYYKNNNLTYLEATFQDYINRYAPKLDHNDPVSYCSSLCRQMSQYNIKPSTPLWIMAKLVSGAIDCIPEPQPPVVSAEARERGLNRRLENEKDPEVKAEISRLLKRLLARVGRTS